MTSDLFPETVVPHVPGPKTWVPTAFVDEAPPAGRAHPSDWISWEGAGHPIRVSFGEEAPDTHTEIAPGEVMMFTWSADHGQVKFFIRPDGSYTTSRPIPPEVNSFWEISDPDTWGGSADEFAMNMAEVLFGDPPRGWPAENRNDEEEIDAGMVQWSEFHPFVLAIGPDGRPAFLPIAPHAVVPQGVVPAEPAVTFADLRKANVARQALWCPDQKPDLMFRAYELGGEAGEALNVVKKLERERFGWAGSRATIGDLADELADIVICADLTALEAGVDLGAAVVAKFNATSAKVGLPTKLGGKSDG